MVDKLYFSIYLIIFPLPELPAMPHVLKGALLMTVMEGVLVVASLKFIQISQSRSKVLSHVIV